MSQDPEYLYQDKTLNFFLFSELGENREILMNVTVSNTGEPAYFAWLNLNFSSVFSFVGRADDVTDILCDLVEDTSIHCNLGNPFLQRTETLQFKLVPSYSPRMPGDVMFTTNISTTSENIVPDTSASMTSSTRFNIVRRSEVSIRGSVRPESILYSMIHRFKLEKKLYNYSFAFGDIVLVFTFVQIIQQRTPIVL